MTAPKNGILMECFSPLVDRSVQDVVEFASSKEYVDACRETRCSKSKPVTSEVLPRLVLNKDKLKAHCRNGVHPAVRSKLWLDVVSVQDHDSVLMAKTLGEPQDGRGGWRHRGVVLSVAKSQGWVWSCICSGVGGGMDVVLYMFRDR